MIEFIKRHHESGRQFEFCFREIYSSDAEKYFVLVRDNGQVIAQFEIAREREKNWKVLSPAPLWIQEAEPEIVSLLLTDSPPLRKICQRYDEVSNQQPSQVEMRVHPGGGRKAV